MTDTLIAELRALGAKLQMDSHSRESDIVMRAAAELSPSRLSANDEGVTDAMVRKAAEVIWNKSGRSDAWLRSTPHTVLREALTAALSTKPEADGDQCDKCHRHYTAVYSVPNDLWAKIAPKPETLGDYPEHQYGGLLCPDCATDAAKALGAELVLIAQPPTPASGEQMEVVAWGVKNESGEWSIKAGREMPTGIRLSLLKPLTDKSAALRTINAAEVRIEQLEKALERIAQHSSKISSHQCQLVARAALRKAGDV